MPLKDEHNVTRGAFSPTIALEIAIEVAGFLPPNSHLILLTNAFIPET
jgi:hypothetical protein